MEGEKGNYDMPVIHATFLNQPVIMQSRLLTLSRPPMQIWYGTYISILINLHPPKYPYVIIFVNPVFPLFLNLQYFIILDIDIEYGRGVSEWSIFAGNLVLCYQI